MVSANFIHQLPKVELHLHIEGTLEPELRFELARRNGVELGFDSAQQVRDSYDFDSLSSFLDAYYKGMDVLRTPDDFFDLAMAYLAIAAEQNVRHTEIFFDPQAHTSRGVSFDTVIKGLVRAQDEAERHLGIHSQLIMCFLRDFSVEHAMSTLVESLRYRQYITGVGLDSDEKDQPPIKFATVFERAKREGYLVTIHCDVDQKNSIDHIGQALREIGVTSRIDHGTNVLEDPELVQFLIDNRIGLTSCPISNSWIGGDTKAELANRLLDRGVKLTINSDDPAYFGGYVEQNLHRVAEEGGWDEARLIQVERNAVDISWAPLVIKDRIRAELDALEAQIEKGN